jgi:hypothetical protein
MRRGWGNADRSATGTRDLRIERLNQLVKLFPRRGLVDTGKKTGTTGWLFLWASIINHQTGFGSTLQQAGEERLPAIVQHLHRCALSTPGGYEQSRVEMKGLL